MGTEMHAVSLMEVSSTLRLKRYARDRLCCYKSSPVHSVQCVCVRVRVWYDFRVVDFYGVTER